MHQCHLKYLFRNLATLLLLCFLSIAIAILSAVIASAQTLEGAAQQQPQDGRPTVVAPPERTPAVVARPSELECSGQIEAAPVSTGLEIVGAQQEQEQRVFAEGDYLFIGGGAQQGLRAGQELSVVRPRGQFRSPLSAKRGSLGIFTQEVGRVRIVELRGEVAVALVNQSCDSILLGDLLRPVPQRVAAVRRPETNLERFASPTGRQTGRIVLSRDAREMISKDQVVFIDLGAEDNIKAGDYLTIFRPVGTGNITRFRDKEITSNAKRGFESERFRGGKFSNQSQRVRNPQDDTFSETVNTPEIKERRPAMPRKVVGEVVVLSVQARTATAVITRVSQEVHTGDYVESQ
ncbi:MAG TPA: hypothetical protein VGV59_14510 [Pyrinomonadaceae bacterium]|nr:hypothetical protein [Pyrinomonadaceae bacterium]